MLAQVFQVLVSLPMMLYKLHKRGVPDARVGWAVVFSLVVSVLLVAKVVVGLYLK